MGMKRINCSWDWVRNVMSVNPDYVAKVNEAIIRKSGDNAVVKALFQNEPRSVATERAATIVRFGNRPVDTDAGDVLYAVNRTHGAFHGYADLCFNLLCTCAGISSDDHEVWKGDLGQQIELHLHKAYDA